MHEATEVELNLLKHFRFLALCVGCLNLFTLLGYQDGNAFDSQEIHILSENLVMSEFGEEERLTRGRE